MARQIPNPTSVDCEFRAGTASPLNNIGEPQMRPRINCVPLRLSLNINHEVVKIRSDLEAALRWFSEKSNIATSTTSEMIDNVTFQTSSGNFSRIEPDRPSEASFDRHSLFVTHDDTGAIVDRGLGHKTIAPDNVFHAIAA